MNAYLGISSLSEPQIAMILILQFIAGFVCGVIYVSIRVKYFTQKYMKKSLTQFDEECSQIMAKHINKSIN